MTKRLVLRKEHLTELSELTESVLAGVVGASGNPCPDITITTCPTLPVPNCGTTTC
jgi:hypothetical protein